MRFLFSILTAATVFAAATVAHAEEYKAGDIRIADPWTRATTPAAKTGGGYMKLTNKGGRPDRLIAASSPVAKTVEIHMMKIEDGVMKMRALPDGLALPPGKTVELKPGGYHIMLKDLTRPILKDEEVPVTLTFERAGKVQIALPAVAQSTRDTRGGDRDHGRGHDQNHRR